MKWSPCNALVLCTFTAILSLPAYAHKLSIFATVSNGMVHGKVYYPSGGASGLIVHLVDAEGKTVAEVTSDASGGFVVPETPKPPFTLVSETEDGHRAEFRVGAVREEGASQSEVTSGTPDGPLQDEHLRALIQQEIQPLREQWAEQADRARVRDVIGGIGYIAGIFGAIALFKSRSGKGG